MKYIGLFLCLEKLKIQLKNDNYMKIFRSI